MSEFNVGDRVKLSYYDNLGYSETDAIRDGGLWVGTGTVSDVFPGDGTDDPIWGVDNFGVRMDHHPIPGAFPAEDLTLI